MARILFINRVYPPRFGTSGRLLRDLARACVKIGHDVTVLTAGRTESTHAIGGKFRLEQVTDNTTPNLFSNLVLFYRLQKRAKKLPKFDLVITLSDPPGLFWLGQRIAKKHRAKHIHWCHDVYPDLLGAQYLLIPDLLLKPLIGLGRKIMARADAVVAISGCMQRYLQRTGFSGLNLTRLDHWPDPALRNDFMVDKQPDDQELQVLYVGSLDEGTHPMETVLNAAAMLVETDRDITFTFVGRGDGFQKLQQTRARRGLENVRLLPPQPLQNQIAFLQSGAVHLVVQGDNTLGLNQPAKALNAAIVSRPLVYIGPSGSDLAAKASVSLRHGDALGLVAALRDYKNNPDKRCQDGVALTNAYAAQAPQGQLVQWLGVIDAVLAK